MNASIILEKVVIDKILHRSKGLLNSMSSIKINDKPFLKATVNNLILLKENESNAMVIQFDKGGRAYEGN